MQSVSSPTTTATDALTTTTTTPTPTQLVSAPSELLLSLGFRPHTLSSNQGHGLSDGVGVKLEQIILTIATIFRYVCICVLVYTVCIVLHMYTVYYM